MGTLVFKMVPDGLADRKKLHPFFTPGRIKSQDGESQNETDGSTIETDRTDVPIHCDGIGGEGDSDRKTKRRKTDSDIKIAEAANADTQQASKRQTAVSMGPSAIDSLLKATGTTSDRASLSDSNDKDVANSGEASSLNAPAVADSKDQHQPRENYPESTEQLSSHGRPKRVLKLNLKTGTIGSPPKSKAEIAEPPRKRGRPPSKRLPPTFIVKLQFGHDSLSREMIGRRINDILSSTPKPVPELLVKKARSRPVKSPQESRKDGKGKPLQGLIQPTTAAALAPGSAQTSKAAPRRQTIQSSTPCSPRKPRPTFQKSRVNLPQFGVKSMGLRVPGATHPTWPPKDMVHITGDIDQRSRTSPPPHAEEPDFPIKKSKGRETNITPQESVVTQLQKALGIGQTQDMGDADDGNDTPGPELRLPVKHFISGRKLQEEIRPQLRTTLPSHNDNPDESEDEIVTTNLRRAPHAVVSRLLQSLTTSLSAFDKSECEEHIWAHKYAPERAAEVLQDGREAFLLRNWLETLKVQSVDTGGCMDVKPGKPKPLPAVKKKRKRAKLDDFIVSSDEDSSALCDVADVEEDQSPLGPKQTIVQQTLSNGKGPKDVRLANAAIISGPHGSGKTAAVYAIAKELGFEIFEINPGSRRSGKDVLERVGDMTRNHQVQRHSDDGKENVDPQTGNEVKSGKQGTMMSFFKPKSSAKADPVLAGGDNSSSNVKNNNTNGSDTAKEGKSTTTSKPAQPKSQQQALILLEEVDVLYEEDKQFWTTITGLMAQSKRPIIMTCNDESLIPWQSLNLHGIFRFNPPPRSLAIDTLLLIAANEGHALRRAPVETLLESRSGDFRAALMELNYWCQIGVGDRRGGFDWFYPRWPRGCDKDEKGDVVRVVSQDTYLEGMGWLGRDAIMPNQSLHTEEELMRQCWDGLNFDLGDWHETLDTGKWAECLGDVVSGAPSCKLAALELYNEFSDALSAADLCSVGRLGAGLQENLDPAHPDMPAKAREDYILGRRLLDAPLLIDQDPIGVPTSVSLKSKARELVSISHESHDWPTAKTMRRIQEPNALRKIRRSFAPLDEEDIPICRHDMSIAFDPIAASERQSLSASTYLDPSVFDRTMRLLTLDVAPYVRGIVAHDRRLADERAQRSSLLSEGGRPGKRLRQTRAAFSASEGGSTLRRESYFRARLNPLLVMRTGGSGWQAAVRMEDRAQGPREEEIQNGGGSPNAPEGVVPGPGPAAFVLIAPNGSMNTELDVPLG